MKKGKVFGKGQLTVLIMVVALGCAIWLNAKYVPSSTKYLGEASYVGNTDGEASVETAAKADKNTEDYFTSAKKERETVRDEAKDTVEEMLDNDALSEEDRQRCRKK